MTFGLRTSNTSGYPQLDENLSIYSLHQSGSFVTTAGGYAQVSFPQVNVIPLVLVKFESTNKWVLARITRSGFTARVVDGTGDNGVVGVTVQYAVFSGTAVLSNEKYGLRMYNSAGVLTFDSGHPAVRMYAAINTHPWLTGGSSRTISYGTALGNPWFQLQSKRLGIINNYEYVQGYRHNAGVMQTASIQQEPADEILYGISRPGGTLQISATSCLISHGVY
jgi:hypothetical protein